MKAMILVALASFGCASAKIEPLRAGTQMRSGSSYKATCKNPGDCYTLADQTCPVGFDVVDSGRGQGGMINAGNGVFIPTQGKTTMLVRCK